MDHIWILPDVFYSKLVACPELCDYFKDKVPKQCFTRMMAEIITCIGSKTELSIEAKNAIEKRHARLNITHNQFVRFIELFLESGRELGFETVEITHIESLLNSLESLFIFDDDGTRR